MGAMEPENMKQERLHCLLGRQQLWQSNKLTSLKEMIDDSSYDHRSLGGKSVTKSIEMRWVHTEDRQKQIHRGPPVVRVITKIE